ncbi:acyltransferase family protein [Sphingomonas arantia]|uniref:Acyltransferase family protein n=1 Tax=Sphingomonas arantia TaxID=1460676 RepID=A0ABW4TXM6_9SPHN
MTMPGLRQGGTTAEREAPATHFPAVQAIRGLAAVMVVLHHMFAGGHLSALGGQLPAFVRVAIGYGWAGVPVFFALSGFVIAHSLEGKRIDLRFVGTFVLRRSIRLDPPYWASIALLLALGVVAALATGGEPDPVSWWQLVTHLTYTQLFAGVPHLGGVYWTLTYEVQFYLVLVLAMLGIQALAQRLGAGAATGIGYGVMLGVALVWGVEAFAPRLHPALFTTFWASFFVGVLSCQARTRGWARAALAVLVVVLLIGGSAHARFSAVTALLLLAVTTGAGGTWLALSALQRLGAVSYSLYLTHNPVSGAAFFLLRRAMPGGAAVEAVHLMIASLACLAVAWLFWRLIEVPAQAVARAVQSRPSAAATRARDRPRAPEPIADG